MKLILIDDYFHINLDPNKTIKKLIISLIPLNNKINIFGTIFDCKMILDVVAIRKLVICNCKCCKRFNQ